MKLRTKDYWEILLRGESQKLKGLAHLIENHRPEADDFEIEDANHGIALILKDISSRVRRASVYLEKDLPYDDQRTK